MAPKPQRDNAMRNRFAVLILEWKLKTVRQWIAALLSRIVLLAKTRVDSPSRKGLLAMQPFIAKAEHKRAQKDASDYGKQ